MTQYELHYVGICPVNLGVHNTHVQFPLAFPSTPHAAILQALSCIGAPAHLLHLVEQIYWQPMNECDGLTYRVHRGIKEGCPLSPALFTLVYQSFHGTLRREFTNVDFFIYVDDIAFIARSNLSREQSSIGYKDYPNSSDSRSTTPKRKSSTGRPTIENTKCSGPAIPLPPHHRFSNTRDTLSHTPPC